MPTIWLWGGFGWLCPACILPPLTPLSKAAQTRKSRLLPVYRMPGVYYEARRRLGALLCLPYTTEAPGMCLRILGAALPIGRLCPAFPHFAFFLLLSLFGGFELALGGFARPFCILYLCGHCD